MPPRPPSLNLEQVMAGFADRGAVWDTVFKGRIAAHPLPIHQGDHASSSAAGRAEYVHRY